MAGARPRDGRPPLPAVAVGQARDSSAGANEDEPEISETAKNLLKQQVHSLSAKVEEVRLPFNCVLYWSSWVRVVFVVYGQRSDSQQLHVYLSS